MSKTREFNYSPDEVKVQFGEEFKRKLQAAFWMERKSKQEDIALTAKIAKADVLAVYAASLFDKAFETRYALVEAAKEQRNKELISHLMIYQKKTEAEAKRMLGLSDEGSK